MSMLKVSEMTGKKVFEPKAGKFTKDGKQALSKIGKVHFTVFSPSGKTVVGFLVKRPDIVGMIKREDVFLALDSYEPCEGGIVATRDKDSFDNRARARLGIDWDRCIEWAGMDAKTTNGKVLGYVSDAAFDSATGKVSAFYVGDGGVSRALVGALEIPADMLCGYKDGWMLVKPDAAHAQLTGGVAAAAGEGYGRAKEGGKELGRRAGKAVDKGAYQLGKALGGAKRVVGGAVSDAKAAAGEGLEAAQAAGEAPASGNAGEKGSGQGGGAKPQAAKQPAKPKDAKAQAAKTAKGAAKAASKQLGKTRGMFAAFKKEFDDASK